jgi:hypothetical protein
MAQLKKRSPVRGPVIYAVAPVANKLGNEFSANQKKATYLDTSELNQALAEFEKSTGQLVDLLRMVVPPKLVGRTLFLEVGTPDAIWLDPVHQGDFREVYVSLDGVDPVDAIGFARRVREEVQKLHFRIDPVVIGPVDSEFLRVHDSSIAEAGITPIESARNEYELVAARRSSKNGLHSAQSI